VVLARAVELQARLDDVDGLQAARLDNAAHRAFFVLCCGGGGVCGPKRRLTFCAAQHTLFARAAAAVDALPSADRATNKQQQKRRPFIAQLQLDQRINIKQQHNTQLTP
jgi:hypothetical protein